jgi:hypothetical protein
LFVLFILFLLPLCFSRDFLSLSLCLLFFISQAPVLIALFQADRELDDFRTADKSIILPPSLPSSPSFFDLEVDRLVRVDLVLSS